MSGSDRVRRLREEGDDRSSTGSGDSRSKRDGTLGRTASDPGGVHPYSSRLRSTWSDRAPQGTGERLPPASPQRGAKARGRPKVLRSRTDFADETESELDEFQYFLGELFAGNVPTWYRGGPLKSSPAKTKSRRRGNTEPAIGSRRFDPSEDELSDRR